MEVDSITVSSTKVRHALTEGDVALAARMMGHRYSLRGQVVQGRHVGTTLGYPTANIVPDEPAKLIPGQGVYALQATVAGKAYKAMANLGPQPTFRQQQPVLEVHLLDFNDDLYGQQVEVQFVSRLRDIKSFDSPEALAAQLCEDEKQTRDVG